MVSKSIQRVLAIAVVGFSLAGAWWIHGVQEVELSLQGLRDLVDDLGMIGPIALVGIIALRPFLALPSAILLAVAGLLFGAVAGALYGTAGGTLGAAIAFWIARVMGREAIQTRLGAAFEPVDKYLSSRGAPWLAAYVALPVSLLSPVFFAAGVTRMSFAPFVAAAAIGFLPRAGLYAFLGRTMAEPSRNNLILASAFVIVAMIVVFAARRYFVTGDSGGESGVSGGESGDDSRASS